MLVLGAGSVTQCVLPLLTEHLLDASQITVMDMKDNRDRISSTLNAGAKFVQFQITQENMDATLGQYLAAVTSSLISRGISTPTPSCSGAMIMESSISILQSKSGIPM